MLHTLSHYIAAYITKEMWLITFVLAYKTDTATMAALRKPTCFKFAVNDTTIDGFWWKGCSLKSGQQKIPLTAAVYFALWATAGEYMVNYYLPSGGGIFKALFPPCILQVV